jgi:hypothetical protein
VAHADAGELQGQSIRNSPALLRELTPQTQDWMYDNPASKATADQTRKYGWLDVTIGARSAVHYTVPLTAKKSGFEAELQLDLASIRVQSSVNHTEFLDAKSCLVRPTLLWSFGIAHSRNPGQCQDANTVTVGRKKRLDFRHQLGSSSGAAAAGPHNAYRRSRKGLEFGANGRLSPFRAYGLSVQFQLDQLRNQALSQRLQYHQSTFDDRRQRYVL